MDAQERRMFRMNGMSRAHGCAGATNVQDERAENCSCIFCTSAIHGGRMSSPPAIFEIAAMTIAD